jgi:ribosomal protein S18 acetylase RimI-like enzyme
VRGIEIIRRSAGLVAKRKEPKKPMEKQIDQTLPQPPDSFEHLIWRPLDAGDIPKIVALSEANREIDDRDANMSISEVQGQLAFLGDKISTDTQVALDPDGDAIIALGLVFAWPADGESRVTLTGSVHADWRRQGLGTYLMNWMEARADMKFAEAPRDLPRRLTANARTTAVDRITMYEQRGYTPARYFNHMSRVIGDPEPVRLPEGIEILPFDNDRAEAIRIAHNETFKEHYNFLEISPEMWQEHLLGGDAFRPALSSVAVDGSEVAGYLLTEVFPDRNTQRDIQEAVMEAIGVRPGYRGRGVASALMTHTLHQYKAAGFTHTALDVDTENATRALQLYEKMGFFSDRASVQYQKAAAP